MATIVHSDSAPSDAKRFSFGNAQIEVPSGGSFETDDRAIVAAAQAHPWLDVEHDAGVDTEYVSETNEIAPEDDALSAVNSVAFDRDEIRKLEEAKRHDGRSAIEPTPVSESFYNRVSDDADDTENE